MRYLTKFILPLIFIIVFAGFVSDSVFSNESVKEDFDQNMTSSYQPVLPKVFKKVGILSSRYSLLEMDSIHGVVVDSVQHIPISDVNIFCFDKVNALVASSVSDVNGAFKLIVPKESYSILVTKIAYYPLKMKSIMMESSYSSLTFCLQPVSTYAGSAKFFEGELAEGNLNDVTLMNSKIAIKIESVLKKKPSSTSEDGNPIDFCAVGRTDGFDWINLPLISRSKLLGKNGFTQTDNIHVDYAFVKILQSSPDSSVVRTQGKSIELPLFVSNLYTIFPNKDWLRVTSSLYNTSFDTVRCWVGDAMDNDEDGQTSIFPNSNSSVQMVVNRDISLQEFHPALPWMGCFGASDQVFGLFYEGNSANDFEVSANTYRIVSQKQIAIPPHEMFSFTRKLSAVAVTPNESKLQAISRIYADISDPDRIETSISTAKNVLSVGSKLTATVTLKNLSKLYGYSQVLVIIKPPISISTSTDTIIVPTISRNQIINVNFNLTCLEGSGNCLINVETKTMSKFMSSSVLRLFVSGIGWYSGDNHTHSTFSDGHNTIEQNVNGAKLRGLSFMNCTDHNTVSQKSSVLSCKSSDFLPFVGSEVTTFAGHGLSLFCDEFVPWDSLRESTIADAQKIIDNINKSKNGTAISVIAHPYFFGLSWKWTDVVNMKGYEVFNGFNPYRSLQTYRSFQLWDHKLSSGVRVYGFADSDAHIKEMVGRLRVCVLAKDFNEHEIYDAINCGRFYGSNGPDLRFSIDSVQMGDSLSVLFKKKVTISLTAYSCDGLDSIRLIKNGQLFKSLKYSTYKRKAEIKIIDEVVPGDYYRMEVNDKLDQIAFSNPIFITYGETKTQGGVYQIIIKDTTDAIQHHENFLYPNPAAEVVTVKFDVNTSGTLRIFDENGIVRYSEAILNKKEHEINIQFLPKGLYYLQINKISLKLMIR